MLKLDLEQTDKHSIKFVLAEKPLVFKPHKLYTNSLQVMAEKNLIFNKKVL
jgi:hypothetical protein